MTLTGKITAGGWTVLNKVQFAADHTGGNFSDCYYVEKDGEKAFLKALDIANFDIAKIGSSLNAFDYEVGLANLCREKRLVRIIQVIENGQIERDPNALPALRNVPFIIFELANGDIRETVDISKTVTNQWRFQVLHQTTLALLQLHKEQIAHQDLKPSNVLRLKDKLKLGDLGRSSLRSKPAPHDTFKIAGALNYAPFEQQYGYLSSDWLERRLCVDVFHLGCLIVFNFTNICFPASVISNLQDTYKPLNWSGPYEQVIDHIRHAMIQNLHTISKDFPEQFKKDLIDCVIDLCDPDPSIRGRNGKQNLPANQRLLEKYVNKFDRLSKLATIRKT